MNVMAEGIEYRRIRVPQQDGSVLVDPPLAGLDALVADNVAAAESRDVQLFGRPIAEVAESARSELLDEALHYTRAYRDVEIASVSDAPRIFLAGHQPELFHPGVWLKNFALGSLAAQHNAIAVNLVIDNDVLASPSLSVPGGSVADPTLTPIAFDRTTQPLPYEERPIEDAQQFAEFGRRATQQIRPLVHEPLLQELWPSVVQRGREYGRVGEAIAQARHQLEGQWGLQTLELPISHVCRFEAYYQFVAHLLVHLPRLWDETNRALDEFRRVHRTRSAAQPLPNLTEHDGWLEAPLWIWTDTDPRRRALFVRHCAGGWELTDRADLQLRIEGDEDDGEQIARQLADAAVRGIKIRPRALTTTMFARIFLGDLFIHGVGGAKYDQLTDALMSRFLGVDPPGYLTISGTQRLPIERPAVSPVDLRVAQHEIREFRFHPERFLTPKQRETTAQAAVASKTQAIHGVKTRENAKTRHDAIVAANIKLQGLVAAQHEAAIKRESNLTQQLRNEAVLGAREMAFCLHPEKKLRTWVLETFAETF